MNIKNAAFEAQLALRSTHDIDIKRTHVHEVFSALLGYTSHAAMSSQCLVIQFVGPASARPLHVTEAAQRAQSLGHAPPTPPVIAAIAAEAMDVHRLYAVRLDDILDALGVNSEDDDEVAPYGFDEFDEGDGDEEGNQDVDANRLHIDLDSPTLHEELKRCANAGDAEAHLALAALIADELEMDDLAIKGDRSYWFTQQQAGHILAGVELEWAEAYRRNQEIRNQYADHMQKAASLGNAEAALQLAEADGGKEAFEAATRVAGERQASRLGQLALQRGNDAAAKTWLRVAATRGDTWAMKVLASELEDELELAWRWVHLASLVGEDVMAYHAVGEDGLPADADEAGPLYASGGFELDRLSPQDDANAMHHAQLMYEQLTR